MNLVVTCPVDLTQPRFELCRSTYMRNFSKSAVNVFSLLYDFLNNTFSLLYCRDIVYNI